MGCVQSRDDYINSIDDLVQMTKHLSAASGDYIATLRGPSIRAQDEKITEWTVFVDALERLIGEERKALEAYRNCRGHLHATPTDGHRRC